MVLTFMEKQNQRSRILFRLCLVAWYLKQMINVSVCKYLGYNKVIRNWQHEFVKHKSRQTNLIFSYDRVIDLKDNGE